jgi:hypothetical protein
MAGSKSNFEPDKTAPPVFGGEKLKLGKRRAEMLKRPLTTDHGRGGKAEIGKAESRKGDEKDHETTGLRTTDHPGNAEG